MTVDAPFRVPRRIRLGPSVGYFRTVVVVPGLGGHPEFHRGIIGHLSRTCRVYSADHGDAASGPFTTFERHVAYWEKLIAEGPAGAVSLVGVSFGAQIAAHLALRLRRRIERLVLISYPPIFTLERTVLNVLSAVPTALSRPVVGAAAFTYSDRAMSDRAYLRQLRRTLYDTREAVHARLLGRLCSLRTVMAPEAMMVQIDAPQTVFVYGKRELWYRCRAARLTRLIGHGAGMRVWTVEGNHAMSLNENAELYRLMDRALE